MRASDSPVVFIDSAGAAVRLDSPPPLLCQPQLPTLAAGCSQLARQRLLLFRVQQNEDHTVKGGADLPGHHHSHVRSKNFALGDGLCFRSKRGGGCGRLRTFQHTTSTFPEVFPETIRHFALKNSGLHSDHVQLSLSLCKHAPTQTQLAGFMMPASFAGTEACLTQAHDPCDFSPVNQLPMGTDI